MTAPNISTITATLERSLESISLNHHHRTIGGRRGESSSTSEDVVPTTTDHPQNNQTLMGISQDTTLELNSHISLPYHWEQCLDLKTGEIYYINWRNGMKAKEDPRTNHNYINADSYSKDECEEDEEDSSYESEESSSESSPPSSRHQGQGRRVSDKETHVLVVAGCKSCLMYFMVPKRVQDCPKCGGHLLHFDRS